MIGNWKRSLGSTGWMGQVQLYGKAGRVLLGQSGIRGGETGEMEGIGWRDC